MARFKVFIKPFEDDGSYAAEYIEVTEDVEMGGLSVIKQSLDNNEYDIGIFKNGGVNLALNNLLGRYSDIGLANTIFKFRRSNSLVKITYSPNDSDVRCGFCRVGQVRLVDEEPITVFEGLLDDTALKQNADEQNLKLKVLAKEGVFSEVLVPFANVTAGDTFEELIYTILNQSKITELLTVSAINITCDINLAVDSVADLENLTVREALGRILLFSNSVLYIKDDVIYVGPREPSAALIATFYGQGATAGNENIIDLSDYRVGLNRTFNFITWGDSVLYSEDLSSLQKYGYRKKELSTTLITDTAKRQTIIDAIKEEFRNPKREFILRVPLDLETVEIKVLDKMAVDYPNVTLGNVARFDSAKFDEAVFPNEILPIEIESAARFKVLSRDVDPANVELVLYLREV